MMNMRQVPQWLAPHMGGSTKHDYYKDFGYPAKVNFDDFYRMYTRNGLAEAAVKLTTEKTWETNPVIEASSEGASKGFADAADRLGLWDKLAEADDMALVGGYSGVILRYADSKRWKDPVENVGGIDALVEVIPAWRGQLIVSEWHTDERDADNYGKPKMWLYVESAVDTGHHGADRSFEVHPDRVLTWSKTGDTKARSELESGYNSLLDCEKISGSGGEGFWKSARGSLKIKVDPELDVDKGASQAGLTREQYVEALSEKVDAFDAGFDKKLFLSGMDAETMPITLPQPEEFWSIPLKTFAASMSVPLKILVGSQTGERASTEDASSWNKTNNARRERWVKPAIMRLIDKLVMAGALLDLAWEVKWDDLTEASPSEKLDRAERMAKVNEITYRTEGALVFDASEIRLEGGYEDAPPVADASDAEMGLEDDQE